MSGIIKFRVWDKRANQMSLVANTSFGDDGSSLTIIAELAPKGKDYNTIVHGESGVLVQYTGLKDRNGREIYESDLLRSNEGIIWQVQRDSERAEFELSWKGGPQPEYFRHGMHIVRDTHCEVIGNIYEHSARLEGERP